MFMYSYPDYFNIIFHTIGIFSGVNFIVTILMSVKHFIVGCIVFCQFWTFMLFLFFSHYNIYLKNCYIFSHLFAYMEHYLM